MLQMRKSLLFMLVVTMFGSFFTWKIVSKAYGEFNYTMYDGGEVVVAQKSHKK